MAWLATCVREKATHRNGPSAHLRHERSLGMPRIAGASAWLGESAIAPDLCDLVQPLLKVRPVSKPAKIWTVGHSNHPADRFLALLQQHGIETVVDVRSQPYSRFSPHFRQSRLREMLLEIDIGYVFRGDGRLVSESEMNTSVSVTESQLALFDETRSENFGSSHQPSARRCDRSSGCRVGLWRETASAHRSRSIAGSACCLKRSRRAHPP